VVADGEPGTPVVPWARVEGPGATSRVKVDRTATTADETLLNGRMEVRPPGFRCS
jgi:hypothetical protein